MGKDKFVDGKLVNIREKLMEESNEKRDDPQTILAEPINQNIRRQGSASVNINDKEWKKAIFQRWDEFKALRRDVLFKLKKVLSAIPEDRISAEQRIRDLENAEEKVRQIIADLEAIDDSTWDRHTLTSELSTAMRMVENTRIESMMISAKLARPMAGLAGKQSSAMEHGGSNSSSSFVHEVNSLTFRQTFKLGLGLFFPLILGIIIAAFILALINYLTLL